MRYWIASITACLVLATVAGFIVRVRSDLNDRFTQEEEQGRGLQSEDVPFEVTPSEGFKINLAHLLTDYWFVWVPLVVVVCFGVAWLLGKK